MKKLILLFLSVFIFFTAPKVNAHMPTQDSLALVSFYNSTDGSFWTNNTNWLNGAVSTWAGITVQDGCVYTISLANNNIEGTIPIYIGNLTGLRNIILNDNSLTGEIPTEIGLLTELSVLNLTNNQMTGSIPSEIANLNMSELSLGANTFSGSVPSAIGTWEFLYNLQLNDNLFTDLPSLSGLPEGAFVAVENNRFEFDDLESNIDKITTYATVGTFGDDEDKSVLWGDELVITANTGGSFNTYKWYNGGDIVEGQTSANLQIPNVSDQDSGYYYVEVKNTVVTEMTLYSHTTTVSIDNSSLNVQITKPALNEKWMAGEKNTIEWTGGIFDQILKIEYSTDEGNSYNLIEFTSPGNSGKYEWIIPNDILTTLARIRISDVGSVNKILYESGNFRIKPYIVTKTELLVGGGFGYYAYNINRDSWDLAILVQKCGQKLGGITNLIIKKELIHILKKNTIRKSEIASFRKLQPQTLLIGNHLLVLLV